MYPNVSIPFETGLRPYPSRNNLHSVAELRLLLRQIVVVGLETVGGFSAGRIICDDSNYVVDLGQNRIYQL